MRSVRGGPPGWPGVSPCGAMPRPRPRCPDLRFGPRAAPSVPGLLVLSPTVGRRVFHTPQHARPRAPTARGTGHRPWGGLLHGLFRYRVGSTPGVGYAPSAVSAPTAVPAPRPAALGRTAPADRACPRSPHQGHYSAVDMTTSDPLVGATLDRRYFVQSRIAGRGMATVYVANGLRLDRRQALKVMPPSLAQDPSFVQRFINEAHSVAKLSHPNVVQVFDQGEDSGHVFLAMEYVPGRTLRDLLREK